MKIRLEGVAGKRFGYEHKLNVRTPNEAIKALCHLLPGFRAFLTSAHEFGIYFQLLTSNNSIGYDHLAFGTSEMTLVPVITGSFFGNPFFKILLGIALVAFAMTGFGTVAAGSFMAGVQSATMSLGFGLVFTGIAGLFAPGVPEASRKDEGLPADQAITNAASATAADGTPVPVVYGETLVTRMPVVSSYIQDGADFDEPEGFWMGVVSEGEIEGFAGSQDDNLFFNGLKASAAGVKDIQFTDGTQTSSSALDLLQNQGFHLRVGARFPIAGGSYEDRLSESVSPNTTEIRSINNPYADKIRVRVAEGAFYQTKTRSVVSNGKTTSSFREYTDTDDSGGADNPLRYTVTAFANGVEFYQKEFPKRTFIEKDESTPDPDDTKEEIRMVNKVLSNEVAVHEIPITGRQHPISVKIERIDRGEPRGPKVKKGGNSSTQFGWVKGDITWLSMEVLWNEKLVYPFTSMLACSFPAGATTSLPAITAKIRGRKVPVVGRNLSINYEYSRNPACVVLDLLTNTRYGAGQRTFTTNAPLSQVVHQPGIRLELLNDGSVSYTDVDLASFYKAQQYCDKHNITFDATIAGDADTLELLRSITSTFQGQLIYIGGAITVVIDDQVKDNQIEEYRLFTEANVIQETSSESIEAPCFIYEGTSRKARSTAVQVSYIDSSNFYKETKVLVEDREAMQKYGYNLKKIRALGCTDRNLAKRLGRYTLATNIRSTETVAFKVGPEGAMLLPGDVCIIGDPLKTRIESGGRIISAIPGQLLVDRELTSNNSYGSGDWKLYTYTNAGVAQKNTVSSVTGSSINIQGSFSSLPSSNMMWILVNEGSTNNSANQFNRYRVQKISEDVDGTFSIIGIKYDHAKYDYVNTDEVDYGGTRLLSGGRNKALRTNSISFKIRNPAP